MTLDRAPKATSLFEAFHKRLLADLATLKSKLPGVSDDDLEALIAKLGGLDKVDALAEAMPDQPTIAEMITAMGGAEALGTFTAQTLGGNVGALAVLADKGCARDADALAKIAVEFKDEPETLGDMLSEGGLGGHPEALAQVFAEGCEGDAKKLMAFCKTFDSPDKREKLNDVLDEGGLGQAPAALGSLAKGDDGAMLLKVAQEADKTALSDMLLTGGMGGEPPDHPDTLKAVLNDALGGDPKRLKDLHTAFPVGADGMTEMQTFFQAMNGKSHSGDAMAGKRMDTLMKAFKRRKTGAPPMTDKEAAEMLYDPFFLGVSDASADARATDESGAGTLDQAGAVIAARADLPKGRVAGAMMAALPDGAGVAMLARLTTDPEEQKQLGDAQDRLQLADANDAAVRGDTEDRAPDGGLSEETRAAIKAADDLSTELDKKLDGGTPKDVDDLTRAAAACVVAARAEPGAVLRVEALNAGDKAMASARAALERQAAQKLAGLADAGAQQSALAAAGGMASRIDGDPDASDGEKAAMQAAADAAGQALGAKALANQAADTATLAGSVATACAERLGKDVGAPEVVSELAALKKAAEKAAKLASSLSKALKSAPSPIDPSLLAQAGLAAQAAVEAGLATADETAMKAALAAGKALADEVARCAGEMAACAETSLAFASVEAKSSVLALNDIDVALAALARDKAQATGLTIDIDDKMDELRAASKEATKSALAASELERIANADAGALADAAEAEARRQAASEGITLDAAKIAANDLAKQKAKDAKDAADALAGKLAPIDETLIKAATKAAQEAASAALGATDQTDRDLAVIEGQRATVAAAKALGDNAKHQLAERTTEKKADAKLSVDNARGPADNIADKFAAGGAPLDLAREAIGLAFKEALGEIGEAAASQLSELATADAGVQDARADAAKAAAAANRPGASQLKKLLSVKADHDAQAKLAQLAVTSAVAAVGGLATVAPPTWPPSPPPPFAQAPMPANPTEAELQNATILCEAAISACTKWVSSATQYKDAAKEFLKLVGKIPDAKRSVAEKADFISIESMANIADDTAGAPKQLVDAKAALIGLEVTTLSLEKKAQLLMHAAQISRMKINDPPGNLIDATNTSIDPADAGLENAAGFAAIIGTNAFKTVSQPGGAKETFGPGDRDSLMATGANLANETRPATFTNPSPPPPKLAVSNTSDIPGHADCEMDLAHMCDRHCRANFTFEPGELLEEEDMMACAMLKARITGLQKNPAHGAARDLFTQDEKDMKRIGSGKTTTMWPEGSSAGEIAAAATLALAQLKLLNTTTDTFAHYVNNVPGSFLKKVVPNILVGGSTMDVVLGVGAASDLGPVNVVMFYPMGEESLTVSDCHKLKKALSI